MRAIGTFFFAILVQACVDRSSHMPDLQQYEISNDNGMTLRALNYGCIVTHLLVPVDGTLRDVVLGFDSLERYQQQHPYFGAVAGRYANRIADAAFNLDGNRYDLTANNGENHLHGGEKGFDKQWWDVEYVQEGTRVGLQFTRTSKHLEEGYPGNLDVKVTYWLTDANEWMITYEATTDAPTVVNLTQHAYFNLSKEPTILNHTLTLHADSFIPVSPSLIPTGELAPVSETPFDFRSGKKVGSDIKVSHVQLTYGGGFDHCWVLNGSGLRNVATLTDPKMQLAMDVSTTEPGIQFYTGNFMDGSMEGKNRVFVKNSGLCLETQHFPDSPNQDAFPSTRLDPDDTYTSTTVYTFREL